MKLCVSRATCFLCTRSSRAKRNYRLRGREYKKATQVFYERMVVNEAQPHGLSLRENEDEWSNCFSLHYERLQAEGKQTTVFNFESNPHAIVFIS